MASHWLLPASVFVGSVLISLATIGPTLFAEDAGKKARRECESLARQVFDEKDPEQAPWEKERKSPAFSQLVFNCILKKT